MKIIDLILDIQKDSDFSERKYLGFYLTRELWLPTSNATLHKLGHKFMDLLMRPAKDNRVDCSTSGPGLCCVNWKTAKM